MSRLPLQLPRVTAILVALTAGPTHACGAVALTPSFSFAITVGGLNVRDVRSGALLWQSPGFAPCGCVNAILANGRVFWPSAASGMIFCWEGAVKAGPP